MPAFAGMTILGSRAKPAMTEMGSGRCQERCLGRGICQEASCRSVRSSSAARTAHFCAMSDRAAANSGVAAAAASLAQRCARSLQSAELAGNHSPPLSDGLGLAAKLPAAGHVRGLTARTPPSLQTPLRRRCSASRHSANAAHISPMIAAMPSHGSKYLMRF
jgi:hypothetical protein